MCRERLYSKSLEKGDNLMPENIIELISKDNKAKKYTDIQKRKLMMDIYVSCGFEMTWKEALEILIY